MERSIQNHILVHFWSTNAKKWWAKVSVLTHLISLDWHCSLGLKFETLGIKVSLSFSNMRHWISKSLSPFWIWDFKYWSLRLGLEIPILVSLVSGPKVEIQKSKMWQNYTDCDNKRQTVIKCNKLWKNVTIYQKGTPAFLYYSILYTREWRDQFFGTRPRPRNRTIEFLVRDRDREIGLLKFLYETETEK